MFLDFQARYFVQILIDFAIQGENYAPNGAPAEVTAQTASAIAKKATPALTVVSQLVQTTNSFHLQMQGVLPLVDRASTETYLTWFAWPVILPAKLARREACSDVHCA